MANVEEHPPFGKTTAIINPMASSGAAKKRWEQVREVLETRLGLTELETRYTEGPNHAAQLCREALESGTKTILAFGGDGTTNEVLCGFVDEQGNPVSGATVTIQTSNADIGTVDPVVQTSTAGG